VVGALDSLICFAGAIFFHTLLLSWFGYGSAILVSLA
jgi:hypothetical protein